MKVNGNKVKKVVLLMALLAPMVYLFGTLFEALKGSNGTITLAQEQEEFVPSSTYEESVSAPLALNPYDVDYVYQESAFFPSDVLGQSIVKDGVIIDSHPTGLLSIGVNQWDEETLNGTLNTSTGEYQSNGTNIVSKNPVRVLSDSIYFITSDKWDYICRYDGNKNYLGLLTTYSLTTGGYFLNIPSDTFYLKFKLNLSYGTTYNNDICLNVSNSVFNGNYYPYVNHEYSIPFPVLRSAGNARDSLDKVNVASTSLENLAWVEYSSGAWYSDSLVGLIKVQSDLDALPNILCDKYAAETRRAFANGITIEPANQSNAGRIRVVSSTSPTGTLYYGLANPTDQLSVSIPDKLALYEGGSVYVESNLVNDIQGQYQMYEGEYVLSSISFSDYLFNQFFASDNFLAASGRKVIDGTPDYGFKPAADLIRFTDSNMFHLANVEYGALVIGYTYYAFHVVCVFLIFNLLMFFPHLIENIYEKFERGW